MFAAIDKHNIKVIMGLSIFSSVKLQQTLKYGTHISHLVCNAPLRCICTISMATSVSPKTTYSYTIWPGKGKWYLWKNYLILLHFWQFPQYIGDWYVQRNIYGTVCERAQYGDLGNGNISVWNTFTAGEAGSQVEGGCAWAEVNDPECDCGDLTVHFPGAPGGPYLILDTDYETFTSVYTCVPFGIQIPWVLTRETNPPEETVKI